jgi:polysaccharide pyruvyl transferase WcaK-like protein
VKTLFNVRATTPNIGNELMALGMNKVLQAVFKDDYTVVTVPASGRSGIKGAGLTKSTIYDINQLADGVIVGPGNLFENGALDVDRTAIGALTTPMMLFAVSTGRVFDRTGQLVARTDMLPPDHTKSVCRAADPVLVRDRATTIALAALECERAVVAGCPALFLDRIESELPDDDPSLADTVLISIRHPRLMSVPNSVRGRFQTDLSGLIRFFREEGLDVRLLCHDYQDLSQAQAFPDVPAMYTEDPIRFLSWLRACRLNVTFRLHAFVASVALGTPSIPLSYDERSMSLIDTLGMKDWMVCFVHSPDVIEAVKARYAALGRFRQLAAAAQPTWDSLRRDMTEGLHRFKCRIDERGRRLRF